MRLPCLERGRPALSKKNRPGADKTELVFQVPVGLSSLERGRRVKKSCAVGEVGIGFSLQISVFLFDPQKKRLVGMDQKRL